MRAYETEKTNVAAVDRSIYDIKDAANAAFEVGSGLTPEIVAQLSAERHAPACIRARRPCQPGDRISAGWICATS